MKTTIESLLRIARAIQDRVDEQYPNCKGATAFHFGAASPNVLFKQLDGAPTQQVGAFVIGAGWDRGETDYGIFTRAIRPVDSGAAYHRYIKNNRNSDSIAEVTNNIPLPVTFADTKDILVASFGTTDSNKTITLGESATKWGGKALLISLTKAATAGARSVALVSAAAENTLCPAGGGALTNSVTLIAGTTSAASRGVLVWGDSFSLFVNLF